MKLHTIVVSIFSVIVLAQSAHAAPDSEKGGVQDKAPSHNHSSAQTPLQPDQKSRSQDTGERGPQPTIRYATVETKDGTSKQVIDNVRLEKDGLQLELRFLGYKNTIFDIWDSEKKEGIYSNDPRRAGIEAGFKRSVEALAKNSPELKNALMEHGYIPQDEQFKVQKEKEKLASEKQQKEKADTMAKVVSSNAENLNKLFKKKPDGSYEVEDDAPKGLKAIKSDFAKALGIQASDVKFRARDGGSAFFGDTLLVTNAKNNDMYLVDKSGNSQLIERGQPALMSPYKDSMITLNQVYNPETRSVIDQAFLGATPMKVNSFGMFRDGGSINAMVTMPDGKKLMITRDGGDDRTIKISD